MTKTTNTNRKTMRSMVKRTMQQLLERKVLVSSITAALPSTTGTVTQLTNFIVQGDNFNQRAGDKITCADHRLKVNATAIVNSTSIRFIILQDMQNNGTTPAVTEVLDTADYLAGYNQLLVLQQRRFKILHDATVDVNIAGEALKTREYVLPKSGVTWYNGATAVAASNGKGALFMLIIASAAAGTGDYTWTYRYYDA